MFAIAWKLEVMAWFALFCFFFLGGGGQGCRVRARFAHETFGSACGAWVLPGSGDESSDGGGSDGGRSDAGGGEGGLPARLANGSSLSSWHERRADLPAFGKRSLDDNRCGLH
jgi:hypothetical protein